MPQYKGLKLYILLYNISFSRQCSLTMVLHSNDGGSFYWCIHRSEDIQEIPEEDRRVFVLLSGSMYLLVHYFYSSGQVNFFVGLDPFL
jgi:hypothetical protein